MSTADQDVAGQTMRLTMAGAIMVFTNMRPGRTMDRPGLQELLAYTRHGNMLAAVRFDRSGRSLAELLTTMTMRRERGIALVNLKERLDTASAAGEFIVSMFGAIAHLERCFVADSGECCY